jgi:hypothetical protein
LNSIFGVVNYGNYDNFPLNSVGINVENMVETLEVNNSSFTMQHTAIMFREAGNPIVGENYFSGGVIYIHHAVNVSITNSNFTQNDGWRTGGIWCEEIDSGVIYILNCFF